MKFFKTEGAIIFYQSIGKRKFFFGMARNRLIFAGLEPVHSHTETKCIAIKINIIKVIWVLPFGAFKTCFNIISFISIIVERLSFYRSNIYMNLKS